MCSKATDPKNPARRPRSPRSKVCKSSIRIEAIGQSLSVIATRSQVGIQIGPQSLRLVRAKDAHVGFTAMDLEQLPPQVRTLLRALDRAMKSREPAIRSRVDNLRAANPLYTNHQLARALIRSTRRRVAATGAAKVVARVVPLGVGIGLGAGFDWLAVTGLGRAAMRYYGPGGPGARPLLLAPEDSSHVEARR